MGIPGTTTAKALLDFATSSYRTYVLNDASAVSKARFYLFDDAQLSTSGGLEVNDILPVQINPVSIQGANAFPTPKVFAGATDPNNSVLYRLQTAHPEVNDDSWKHEVNIDLKYNIYDEYKVATMDGMLGAVSSLSLENKDVTSLYTLVHCVPRIALFVWGDIQLFGMITNVSYTYESFSRFGNPLSASATVTMNVQPSTEDFKWVPPLESDIISDFSKAAINAGMTADKVTTTAAMVAGKAIDLATTVIGALR